MEFTSLTKVRHNIPQKLLIRFIEDLAGLLVHHLEINRRLLSNKGHTKRQTKWKGIKPQEGEIEKPHV